MTQTLPGHTTPVPPPPPQQASEVAREGGIENGEQATHGQKHAPSTISKPQAVEDGPTVLVAGMGVLQASK